MEMKVFPQKKKSFLKKGERKMRIVVGADPWAVDLKEAVKAHLIELGHDVTDVGGHADDPVKYYDAAVAAARKIQSGEADRAVLCCGTGMGMSIVANKFKGIYASVVESALAARMCRAVNDSNVLALGALFLTPFVAIEAVDAWLTTKHTTGLEEHTEFLRQALKDIAAIEESLLK
jgi:ribose 5-phosphate isomerase B